MAVFVQNGWFLVSDAAACRTLVSRVCLRGAGFGLHGIARERNTAAVALGSLSSPGGGREPRLLFEGLGECCLLRVAKALSDLRHGKRAVGKQVARSFSASPAYVGSY